MGEESVGRFGQLLPENAEAEAMLEGTNELIEDQQEHAREEEEQPQTEEQQLQEFLRQMVRLSCKFYSVSSVLQSLSQEKTPQ